MPSMRSRLRFTLYSNAGEGCAGRSGGAPGESVYVKAGGVAVEPNAVESGDGGLMMNLDKGQSVAGRRLMRSLWANLAAAGANCAGSVFVPKQLTTRRGALASEADRDGNLGSDIGTDFALRGADDLLHHAHPAEAAPPAGMTGRGGRGRSGAPRQDRYAGWGP